MLSGMHRTSPHFSQTTRLTLRSTQALLSYQNAKHSYINANQMHPVATLDVTVSGKFDFAKANVIIQTTDNNQAIHINLAKAYPVDLQHHLYYFYVQAPGGKEYLITFRVGVNNQLTER